MTTPNDEGRLRIALQYFVDSCRGKRTGRHVPPTKHCMASAIEALAASASPAAPSAERILTQATDVDEIAQRLVGRGEDECTHDNAVGDAGGTFQNCWECIREELRKHIPARSGAAVVNMPERESLIEVVGRVTWSTKQDDAKAVDACLAEFRSLNGGA